MKKNEVKIKKTLEFSAAKAILENLVKSFGEKTVVIESGNDFVTLSPADTIDIELEASCKKNKEKIVIELTWKKELPVAEKPEAELKISSTEPEIIPPVIESSDIENSDE